MRNGDISHDVERVPKIPLTDLKTGDALVVSGEELGADNSRSPGYEPRCRSLNRFYNPRPSSEAAAWVIGAWGGGEMEAPQ